MGRIWSVGELTTYIKHKLESDEQLHSVWVRGELSNCKLHHSGHIYLTLKDKSAAVKGVMFRSRAAGLRFRPEDGMSVLVRGYISVYERDGAYQLYVEEMQPDGVGALYIAFQQLKDRLEKEGLFAAERKKLLPVCPRKICVVTAPGAAALRDILSVIERRYATVHLVIIPSAVQGERAPAQLAWALAAANKVPEAEVIIVARGGGSLEELWAFNTETVARAIAASHLPVISAVGHETDVTIADYVADLRAATPSAAAELVLPLKADLREQLQVCQRRLERCLRQTVMTYRRRFTVCRERRVMQEPRQHLLSERQQQADQLLNRAEQAVTDLLQERRQRLAAAAGQLQALSPLATLERGYSICLTADGQVLTAAAQAAIADRVQVLLQDGQLTCRVTAVAAGNRR